VKLLLCATLLAAVAAAEELPRVEAGALCVTRGRIGRLADGRLRIDEPKVRAALPGSDGNQVELRFVYAGPTESTAPLGSGELRRQIGVKLRAQDGCNLLYVMWRLQPKPGIVVSVKRNPGARTHAECANRGYRNLRGDVGPAPEIATGSAHVLRAALAGATLRVWADGKLAWEGDLGADAAGLSGPVGLRSDNGRFEVELRAPAHAAAAAPRCVPVDEE